MFEGRFDRRGRGFKTKAAEAEKGVIYSKVYIIYLIRLYSIVYFLAG
jgi:hypothetical protein